MRSSARLVGAYNPELIFERQQIITELHRLNENDTGLPLVSGKAYDPPGTNSAEQGLSLHRTPENMVVGYHIIDTSTIPEGGILEYYGYKQQRTLLMGGEAIRMFGDKMLYRHLNLNSDKQGLRLPVVSFYFSVRDDELILQEDATTRSLFENVAEASDDQQDLEELLGPFVPDWNRGPLLQGAEYHLNELVGQHVEEALSQYDLPMLRDRKGLARIHRPLRVWTDFKNLQLYMQILDGRIPLYSAEQFDYMQRYAEGERIEPLSEHLAPAKLGQLLLNVLKIPDIRKAQISSKEWRTFAINFDPEENQGDPLLVNIFRWAERSGHLITVRQDDVISFEFRNLDVPVKVKEAGEGLTPSIAYQALLEYLQRRDRPPQERANSMLTDFRRQAMKYRGITIVGRQGRRNRKKK